MNMSTLKSILQYKHEILVWLIGAFIVLLMLSIVAYKSMSALLPDKTLDTTPSTLIDAQGCLYMPDGIKVCERTNLTKIPAPITLSANLDKSLTQTHLDGFQNICSLFSFPTFKSTLNLRTPRPEVVKALNWMTEQVGISSNFTVLAADFTNSSSAFAAVRGLKRYIVYDANVNFLTQKNTLDFSSLGILGHELGHHLAGHTHIHNQPPHTRELEADKFSGFILQRLGATLEQASLWTNTLSSKGAISHPARHKRAKAVKAGWLLANKTATATTSSCATTWNSEEIVMAGKTCRLAQLCIAGKPSARLACNNESDHWEWVN